MRVNDLRSNIARIQHRNDRRPSAACGIVLSMCWEGWRATKATRTTSGTADPAEETASGEVPTIEIILECLCGGEHSACCWLFFVPLSFPIPAWLRVTILLCTIGIALYFCFKNGKKESN